MASVKPEIKVDAADDDNRALAQVEQFEDDNELRFPETGEQSWLVKVPVDLWESWNNIYANTPDDTQIEIGKLRVYNTKGDDQDPLKQKIEIALDSQVPQHGDIPAKYELHLNTVGYSNTVVFSEKDLEGHKSMPFRRNRNLAKPTGLQQKNERYGGRPGYRTAIPKHVRLAPQIAHEASAAPIEDEAFFAHLKKRWDASTQPKAKVQFTEGIDRRMHPGLTTNNAFTLSSKPGAAKAGQRKKAPKEKAVRISQDQLIDALYKCFRRYRYWSLKALRNELKQPEQYIKETLDEIGILIRSGDFAMNYELKPQYRQLAEEQDANAGPVKEEMAKVETGTDSADEDDEDDMIDLE
ncbi:Hypothetical protein R9X50_00294200 [Acrodontium crateriforme]|uniref:Transcription initiation factor IIF subunit beta n=1 Tax=Acrodontium crateriforme TaxID=150365 RepID=A0AAQ3R726_9PEZI|nr:Hypothetical protein R9X50_00294200 [Acrodontium crateriforme]